jgi:hypothetical protein
VFCEHHLSAGTICRKLVEFLQLRQENRSVYDYTQEFNNLTQWCGHHVDSDAKKAKLYLKGAQYFVAGPPSAESELVLQ